MKKLLSFRYVLLASLILSPFLLMINSAHASTPSQGFTITPPIFELKANPGDNLSEVVSIYNSSQNDLAIAATVENLKPMGENGQVQVIGSSDEGLPTLQDWIKIPTSTLTVTKAATKNVTFSINVPANAEPGGHFATVLFGTTSSNMDNTGSQISQKIGTLVLLTVAGTSKESAHVTFFSPKKKFLWQNQDINFNLKIANDGNVYVRPRGFLVITDIFGRKIEQIETDGKNILPTATRDIPLSFKSSHYFGPYTASLTLVYGNTNQNLSATCGFWVIPWLQTLITLIILALIIIFRRRLWKALKILAGREK